MIYPIDESNDRDFVPLIVKISSTLLHHSLLGSGRTCDDRGTFLEELNQPPT